MTSPMISVQCIDDANDADEDIKSLNDDLTRRGKRKTNFLGRVEFMVLLMVDTTENGIS